MAKGVGGLGVCKMATGCSWGVASSLAPTKGPRKWKVPAKPPWDPPPPFPERGHQAAPSAGQLCPSPRSAAGRIFPS